MLYLHVSKSLQGSKRAITMRPVSIESTLLLLLFLLIYIYSTLDPIFGVDAKPWFYHLGSFNSGDIKARVTGRIVAIIWLISCDNWEVGKNLRFFLGKSFFLLRRVGIMFDNNYREYYYNVQCCLYSISERGKNLGRQDWSFLNEVLSLERVCGF